MKHTYSADKKHFLSADTSAEFLSTHCTRNQSLQLRKAVDIYWRFKGAPTHYPCALAVASQLKYMRADVPTIIASLLGNDVLGQHISADQITETFGQEISKLTTEVRWLNELTMSAALKNHSVGSRNQAEVLRRMVLSMVGDIRVVLVKLAYRTQRLYEFVKTDTEAGVSVAKETLDIFAPLANRLGLGQLKWELEDVAFHIVEPTAYKRIAAALEESRADREVYIRAFVQELSDKLIDQQIETADVFGRPKHIYSIWKKMQNKRIEFSDLFDVRAVRVLVDTVTQCYGTLGIVHNSWQPIRREFDDYIANPKHNGYQSLHTAVIGPKGKPVEVQIRTREMDNDAENGVAAHWAYKEGGKADEKLQKSISALRQLLEDSDEQLVEGFSQSLDANRVYVFTPDGEVIDLVVGATPLDFAYHVHSEIGHRCRGAKVNGSIVNLTYLLQNGDRVEILTTREPSPSRDWLNKSLGYLQSSRARGKVRAWFNTQDHAQHLADGRAILDRELKRLKAGHLAIEKIAKRLKFDKTTDLFAAVGRNDITLAQIAGATHQLAEPDKQPLQFVERAERLNKSPDSISVRGVGKLLTNIASCCQPVPHDGIVGFITRGKGVTIHRADCGNILSLPESEEARLIEVSWGSDSQEQFNVDVRIIAFDRVGLLRDVSTVMANNHADVVAVNTKSDPVDQTAEMRISVMIGNMAELTALMDKVRLLRNVSSVERVL